MIDLTKPAAATYVSYPVGTKGGEPNISFDRKANAAMYTSITKMRRLTWDDSVKPAKVKVETADAPTSVDSELRVSGSTIRHSALPNSRL